MGLDRAQQQIRICKNKTAVGNVYVTRAHAKRAVRSIGKRCRDGQKVLVAFPCPVCGLFHIGRDKRQNKLHRPDADRKGKS